MTTTLEHPPVQQQPQAQVATGVLDIDGNGKGYLRSANCLPTPNDVQVSAALIRRYGLRKGDTVEGVRGGPRALAEVERINGRTPQELRGRPHFRDLTPLHPATGFAWNTRRAVWPGASSTCSRRSARASAA